MEYLITAYPSTPTPAMILTPPARAYSPSPSPEIEPQPIASTSQPQPSKRRRVLDHILLPRLPAGWLSAPPPARASEPVQDAKACHQCRNLKNPHPRFRCGRAGCVRAFCSGCLARRYGWTPQDVHARGCPDCRGVCNCSRCLDRAGLGKHKAFLTADARAGGCARKWLAERGLLVEGAAPPQKKNVARRPKILAKKQSEGGTNTTLRKATKTQPKSRPIEYDDDQDGPRSRGRWIIDASTKLVRRWARERAVRGAQVRAGTRRWFVGASPPPRPRARDDTAGAPLVETIDLTLDDDEDAPDSLFDAKSDAQPARDDKTEDDDAPDSLFDEKTEDEEAPGQDADAADDKSDAPVRNVAPDDKDDDKDSLFDGDPGTPAAAAPSPPHILPAPVHLPSTPAQLPSTPVHLAPTPIQLPPTPTPLQLPPTPTPIHLPPASPIVSLARSDSYTDALRIDVELAVPSSPAKGAVDVHITFGDAFGASSTSPSVSRAGLGTASPVAVRSPVTATAALTPTPTNLALGPAPASPATNLALSVPLLPPAPAPPPKSPPKTSSKAASAMFIPRAKPVAKRKRDSEERKRDDGDKRRLDAAKSSAGVLVALGRAGRKRVRGDDDVVISDVGARDGVPIQEDEAPGQEQTDGVTVRSDDALAQNDGAPTQPKDGVPVRRPDETAAQALARKQRDAALLSKDDAPAQKRPREDDASTLDDERPAKRAALSKETARKPRAPSPECEDDEPRAASSKQTARASSSRHEDSNIVDGLPTPKPTHTKHSAADALAQAMRAAYGGTSASTSDPQSSASTSIPTSAPVASSSNARAPASNTKRSKPTVLAQRAAAQASGSNSSLAIALKTPVPSAASALAAAYKQAYAAARAPSPASTLRSSPTPEKDKDTSKPALHDELSTFIGRFDDNDKEEDEEPTPELLPSDLAAQSEGSSRTGPVSPLVAHRRPPTILTDAEDGEEEMPARRPFVPCNPRRFVGMPLRFVPAKKRPRPSAKRVERAVVDLDTDDEYKDDEEDDFGLARRRKRSKLWEQSAVMQAQSQVHEPIVVLDDSDDSDFQPAPALVKKSAGSGKGKGKSKSFGPGKGKTKPRKLPLSTFIAYSYTPPPTEPETMPEPVFVPDDDTAAAPPASEVWLGAAMAPLSPDLGLTRAVADAWFSAV